MPKLPALSDQSKPAESGKFGGLRRSVPARNLSVRVYRKYGAIEIEFGVSMPVEVESQSNEQRLWLKLYREVIDMHDEWAQNELPNIQSAQVKSNSSTRNGSYQASTLYRKSKNGSWEYYIKTEPGTPFGKYGAVVKQEVSKKWYLGERMGDKPELDVSGYIVSIENGVVTEIKDKES